MRLNVACTAEPGIRQFTDNGSVIAEVQTYSYGNFHIHWWPGNPKLTVGRYSAIALGVEILLGGDHDHTALSCYPLAQPVPLDEFDPLRARETHSSGPVTIGHDVWIGTNALILSGVTIGNGAVIGAGAVVSTDVAPYAIVAGNPARVVGRRFTPEDALLLETAAWWDLPHPQVLMLAPLLKGHSVDLLITAAQKARTDQPDGGFALLNWIAESLAVRDDHAGALAAYAMMAKLAPGHPAGYDGTAWSRLWLGETVLAQQAYMRRLKADPLLINHRANTEDGVRVLLLVAGEGLILGLQEGMRTIQVEGHWESQHLLYADHVSVTTLHLLADTEPEAAYRSLTLAAPNLIVNAIADPDRHGPTLRVAESLCKAAGLSVINDPGRILTHGRDQIAAALKGIEGLIVPKVLRLSPGTAPERKAVLASHGLDFPLILRECGTQTGYTMERVDDNRQFETFLTRHASAEIYAIQYHEFASPDGWHRKYRVRAVGAEILPNHLFIDQGWKVHAHASRALMAQHDFMRREEENFVSAPLPRAIMGVMQAIHTKIGTDFYGIDYAVMPSGEVLFFEANAAMRSIYPEFRDGWPITAEVTGRLVESFRRQLLPPRS